MYAFLGGGYQKNINFFEKMVEKWGGKGGITLKS